MINDILLALIIIYSGINVLGVIINVDFLWSDDNTLFERVKENRMNLFGKTLLTLLLLIVFPIWTVLELIFRLFGWLCYLGK